MIKIETKTELVDWFEKRIWATSPKREMPYGFVYTFRDLFACFRESGRFDVTDSQSAVTYMTAVLDDVVKTHEKERTASVRIVEFIGGFHGRLIDNQGTVSFVQFVEIAAQVLRLAPDALRANKRLLVSSSNFEQSHATKVRIPLTRGEGFSIPKEQVLDASLYTFG